MDLDLLSGFLAEPEPASSRTLLSDLPHNELTAGYSGTRDLVPKSLDPAQVSDIFPKSMSSAPLNPVVAKIEAIFEAMTDCILKEKGQLTIQLKSRHRKKTAVAGDGESPKTSKADSTMIRFPTKSPREAWKFAALLRILELSYEALVTATVTTKRDIYYRDPELFMKQAVVDRYVDDLACTFGVDRDALNVVAAAKGLVAGSFSIVRKYKSVIDFSTEDEGILVPNTREIEQIELQDVKWILVIEKEATFRTLATSHYWRDSQAGKGIIITAKGYPDIQTRQFLHHLYAIHPELPIHALVDFDPDGLGIASTYKHGSINLSHQSSLTVPSLNYLGVRSSDFVLPDRIEDERGILRLLARDRRIAGKMLEREDLDEEWRRELRVMLVLNVKAEIQILGGGESLGRWLDEKLCADLMEDIVMEE
ncbi:Spo11/DNA topoisomerase VI subunit A [Halenospora varia]|nr:Spo11/DNA topoisomerase VI subunit A [Halenospora varia]